MDRRKTRREILAHTAVIEVEIAELGAIATRSDSEGDPILAGELRRYIEKATDLLDNMYEWAGKL